MKTIEYSPEGEAIADEKAERRAIQFLKSDQEFICISNESFINAIRVHLYEKRYPVEQVRFLFRGEYLPMNKWCRFSSHPRGFLDINMDFLMRLITLDQ
jgi:hypothetical protein